ncbi:NAD(P)H-dependent oxidoreductase [Methylopila sp. M107]|uniref:NAD(P)H-dependent oxidoreductase n=1 Tax=Methylopila sp. M107 TaxID=1101190 RepID=UPI000381B1EE|nr:NAD(P)H-dependent oxidoreductase [Methylopila sp. M107]
MPKANIVAISGSASARSRTRVVLEDVVQSVAERVDSVVEIIDVGEIADLLGHARLRADAPAEIELLLRSVERADLILAASPVYKGSYTGLFKHFVDMIDHRALADRPVGLIATGGGDRHALVIEHQLRPLFGFFNARTLPTGVYIAENQHHDGHVTDPFVRARLDQLATEAVSALARAPERAIA